MVGSQSNLNTDPFYVKDFGIDVGGAINNYQTGGYAFATTHPKCILKTMKNAVLNQESTGYCILCEWGYYVSNGLCVQGNRYCDLNWVNCVPDCLPGWYADTTLF